MKIQLLRVTLQSAVKNMQIFTFSPVSYRYEITHLIVNECLKVCFLQFALVTRVFVENLDNSDHSLLQI